MLHGQGLIKTPMDGRLCQVGHSDIVFWFVLRAESPPCAPPALRYPLYLISKSQIDFLDETVCLTIDAYYTAAHPVCPGRAKEERHAS